MHFSAMPDLLAKRQCGLKVSFETIRQQIKKREEKKLIENLIKNQFSFKEVELPGNAFHRIFRCEDYIAILSVTKTSQKIQSLALFSLTNFSTLWEVEINSTCVGFYENSCFLSDSGMILIDSMIENQRNIFFNGKITATLENFNFKSVSLIGERILGCSSQLTNENGLNQSSYYFNELDKFGKSLYSFFLNSEEGRQKDPVFASSDQYWVRLLGQEKEGIFSIIEIVDRVTKTLTTFKLPETHEKEKFSSAYIYQNYLFFGKSIVRLFSKVQNIWYSYDPSIFIYNLQSGQLIKEFSNLSKIGEVKHLVANQDYITWLELSGSNNNYVKYLNIKSGEIRYVTDITYYQSCSDISIKIIKKYFFLIYVEDFLNSPRGHWCRKVIDMKLHEIKCSFKYEKYKWGDCSFSNGQLLINDNATNFPKMYISDFKEI